MSGTKNKGTTQPEFENRNGQVVIRRTELRGNDHGQWVYELRCKHCDHHYGANGSDIWQRKCPQCAGGQPGLPLEMVKKLVKQTYK